MAAVLILAHAPLASALATVAEHTFPDAGKSLRAVDVQPGDTPEAIEARAREVLKTLADLDGTHRHEVLVLSDVFGATPCNIAQRLSAGGPFVARCVTGVNVPMLWRALNYLGEPLDQLVARAMAGGGQGVMQVAASRPQNQNAPTRSPHDQDQRHRQQ